MTTTQESSVHKPGASTHECDITKDTIMERMMELGVRSEEIYEEGWILPSHFLKLGVGIQLPMLDEKIANQLERKEARVTHREEGENGWLHIDLNLLGVEKPRAPQDGHMSLSFIVEVDVKYGEKSLTGKFKLKPRAGFSMEMLKLESHDSADEVTYDLKFDLAGKHIDWVFSKITVVIPNWLKDQIIKLVNVMFDTDIVLHTMAFSKKIQLPSLEEGGSPVSVDAPLPKIKNLSFTTNAYYNMLIIGWTAGTSGMREDDKKRISKHTYKSGKFMQVVTSPNFLYDEIVVVIKALFHHWIFKPVNAQTVRLGDTNVFGVSLSDVKYSGINIELVKFVFTALETELGTRLGGLAQVKAEKAGAKAELGFCINQDVGAPEKRKVSSAGGSVEERLVQDIMIHVVEGYQELKLTWWQKALLAAIFGVNVYLGMAIVGKILNKLAELKDNTITLEYDYADYAPLSDLSVIPTPHLFKNSYWISIGFDEPKTP